MTTLEFDDRQMDKYQQELREMERNVENAYIQNLTDFMLSQAQYNLRVPDETKAFDTGELYRSGVAEVDKTNKTGTVGFAAPHAEDVEFGRDPGSMPPVDNIIAWARRVGIRKPDKVGWAIAKTIKEKGIEQKPFLRNAVETTLQNADRIWEETLQQFM